MRPQPLPGEASRRRAEEQFKTTKKATPKARRPISRTASGGRENGAPTRASAGQGSSRQGDCKSRRRGSAGREI